MNRSSVNVFSTTMSSSVAEASTCTMKYFNEASVLYMFLTLDIRGTNDIRLISRPIHAPSHELNDTDTPPTKVISKRIFVELLGITEESVLLYLWGMNTLAYFSLLFYLETVDYILVYGARRFLMLYGDSLILLDVMKVIYLLHVLSYHDSPLIRFIIADCNASKQAAVSV